MLILVAGATGHIGQHLISALHARGHIVRALGRTPSKLSAAAHSALESFVQSASAADIPALDAACAGVDAVICAYGGTAELVLDGQLLLLRAAERAGVRRFVAAGWTYDWRGLALGVQESYDAFISFARQAELTSPIRPAYIFCGVLAEVLFATPGHIDFSTRNGGPWDADARAVRTWGTGDEVWHWTTERDAAAFAAAVVEREDVGCGGFWSVCSGQGSLRELAEVYARVRGVEVAVEVLGSVEVLRERALRARSEGVVSRYWEYIGLFYHLHTVDGTWALRDIRNEELGVETTSLEEFLRENPEV